jgi:hypothetical protein
MPLFFVRICPTGSQSIFSKYTEGLGRVHHVRPPHIGKFECQSTLHTALAVEANLLDRGLPMIGYLMPSAAPLILCLIGGFTALTLHIPSDFDGGDPDLALQRDRD